MPYQNPAVDDSSRNPAAEKAISDTMQSPPSNLQRTILESITDGFVALDHDFRYTWVNSTAEQLSGKPRSELIGRILWDVFPDAIGTAVDIKGRQALQQQTAVEFENYMPAWDRWFWNKIYPTNDGGLVIFWREITAAKLAEAELRRQAQTLEQIHDSVISTDLNGIITDWNLGAEHIFEYASQEAIGKHVSMLYFEEDRSRVGVLVFEPLMRDGKLVLELRNQRKSGEECFIRLSLSLVRHDDGIPFKVLGIATDITGQRKAERFLRESEELHRGLTAAVPGIVFRAGADGNTTMMGGRWEEYSGVQVTESAGMEWMNRIHQEDIAELKARWAHCIQTGEPFQMLYRVRNAAGVHRWHLSRAMPVRETNGVIREWVGALFDVHDSKTSEDELRISEERLRLAQQSAGIQVFEYVLDDSVPDFANGLPESGKPFQKCMEAIHGHLGNVHPDDQVQVRADLSEALKCGSKSLSVRYRSIANGIITWQIFDARVLAEPRPLRVIGVLADITSRKQAEEAKANALERRRLESIIEHLSEAVIILGPDSQVISMNPAAVRMHDFKDLHWASVPLSQYPELLEASQLDGTPIAFTQWPGYRALQGEIIVGEEVRIRNRKSGHSWVALCNGSPVRSETGEIVMAVVSIWDTTAVRTITEEMQSANVALQNMSAQLLHLQDQERKRIAREVHDGTLQLISAMSMNLLLISRSPALIGDPEMRKLITEAQNLAKQSSRELRTLSYVLHPPDLDDLGLAVALRSWADGFAQRTGIELTLKLDDPGRLNPNMETTLFRIAQEALVNVHRHSGSPTAELRIMVSEQNITLQVEDRGCGIPATTLTGDHIGIGVGLLGMRERARQLGGSLQLGSNPNGTTVVATLPRTSAP